MAGKIILAWIGICIVSTAYITQAAASGSTGQEEYRSESNGFSVRVPAGWHKIPSSVIKTFRKTVFKDSFPDNIEIDTVFQAKPQPWFEHPYVMLQVVHYGAHRQPNEREMRQMLTEITGIDEEDFSKLARKEVVDLVGNLKTLDAQLFPEERRFTWEFRMDVALIGRVRGSVVGYFGYRSLVTVNCYCLESQYSRLAPMFQATQASFRFTPEMEYRVVAWYESRFFAIGLIAAATSLLAYTFRERKS